MSEHPFEQAVTLCWSQSYADAIENDRLEGQSEAGLWFSKQTARFRAGIVFAGTWLVLNVVERLQDVDLGISSWLWQLPIAAVAAAWTWFISRPTERRLQKWHEESVREINPDLFPIEHKVELNREGCRQIICSNTGSQWTLEGPWASFGRVSASPAGFRIGGSRTLASIELSDKLGNTKSLRAQIERAIELAQAELRAEV